MAEVRKCSYLHNVYMRIGLANRIICVSICSLDWVEKPQSLSSLHQSLVRIVIVNLYRSMVPHWKCLSGRSIGEREPCNSPCMCACIRCGHPTLSKWILVLCPLLSFCNGMGTLGSCYLGYWRVCTQLVYDTCPYPRQSTVVVHVQPRFNPDCEPGLSGPSERGVSVHVWMLYNRSFSWCASKVCKMLMHVHV